MHKIWICAVVLMLTVCGCFWPFSSGHRRLVSTVVDDGVSLEVLNAGLLQKAKKIYFEPLSAGADAEAGEALDRLALMVIKGFSDDLAGGRLVLVSGDDAASADIVIKGHIDEFKVQGHLSKVVSMKIHADVRSVPQDEVLALFFAKREFKDKSGYVDQSAYNVGHVMAQKLLE